MNQKYWDELGEAIKARSSLVFNGLNPGLSETEIRALLKAAGVTGFTQPLLGLYGWHNGVDKDIDATLEEASLFPRDIWGFPALMYSLNLYENLAGITEFQPQLKVGANRYFPAFWDGSNNFILVDLAVSENPVLMMQGEESDPYVMLYERIGDFWNELLRVNLEGDNLSCFK